MLDFEEWKVKRYRPTIPNDEDLSQDPADYRSALKEDQEKQYAEYVTRFEPSDNGSSATVVLPVVQPKQGTKKDAQWWKNYRLQKKLKPKICRHCGKLNP